MPENKQIPVHTPKKKNCANCHEPFIPMDKSHELCYSCWRNALPKCRKCGGILSTYETSQGWHYHSKCFPSA